MASRPQRERQPVERMRSSELASAGRKRLATTGKREPRQEVKQEAEASQSSTPTRTATKRQRAAGAPVNGEMQQAADAAVEETEAAEVASDDENELSEYEKMRKANMDRNQLILDSLALPAMPVAAAGKAVIKARGLKGTPKAREQAPTRERSLRCQGKAPDGKQLELPADWREPVRFNPSSRKEAGGGCSKSMSQGEETEDRRLGDITVADCVPRDVLADEPDALLAEDRQKTDALLARMKDSVKSESSPGVTCEMTVEALKGLTVSESDVAKVCRDRIVCISFHPMERHVVVAAGDKRGHIGIFTPDWAADDSCVTQLRVHRQSTTWLSFDTTNPMCLYSSSYENIVRRLDIEKQMFEQVHLLDEDEYNFLATCHLDSMKSVVRCGFGTGHLQTVDTRGGRPSTVHLHDKTIRCIDVSPGNSNLMLTASIDHYARLWDIRKLRRGDFLAQVQHAQGVTQARFGQAKGDVAITTSYDDSCKVMQIPSGKTLASIRHNNSTGRWLTAFQAVFVPGSDKLCVIGSMEAQRGIDVIDVNKGARTCRLQSEAYASITSVNTMHPTRKLLVGGNSSGKVFLWR